MWQAKKLLLALALMVATAFPSAAQPLDVTALNRSAIILAGGTFQSIYSAAPQNATTLRAITVENNNNSVVNTNGGGSDICWVEFSGAVLAGDTLTTTKTTVNAPALSSTAGKISIALSQYGAYGRYVTFIPRGPVMATCQTTGDSLYIETE